MKFKIAYILPLLLSALLFGCADDLLYEPDTFIPEGESDFPATVSFEPGISVSLGNTRAAGDAIKSIESLCVLVYDENKDLVRTYSDSQTDIDKKLDNYKVHDKYDVDGEHNSDSPAIGNGEHQAEAKTPYATFTLKGLPFGRYYIYAVANMGDLSAESSEYKEAIQTIDGLKSIKLNWLKADGTPDEIRNHNQMFGHFTVASEKKLSKSTELRDNLITLNTPNQQIHSWIKRAVSKVTIAYDASGLKDDVWIYIKNVTIHDIPEFCFLGKNNTITNFDSLLNRKTNNHPDAGEYSAIAHTKIDYTQDIENNKANHIYWKDIDGIELFNGLWEPDTNNPEGKPVLKGSDHSETADALFFFENNQGNFDGQQKYHKVQYKDGDDKVGENIREDDGKNDYKDRRPYGTYIEVEAYYISKNKENPGSGDIKYRFMLGKDISYDYNAQRNYHFKLTLGFNGWANQPDWHIDYNHTKPALEVPPVFRVSYIYHQQHMMPIRIAGDCTNLEVKIVENNWAPYDPNGKPDSGYVPTNSDQIGEDSDYKFQWNEKAFGELYFNKETVVDSDGNTYVYNSKEPQLGFLALSMPKQYSDVKELPTSIPEKDGHIMSYQSGKTAWTEVNNNYYDPANTSDTQARVSYSENELKVRENAYTDKGTLNNWYVRRAPLYEGKTLPDEKIVEIPLWTRAKTIIANAGFSGNNPYEFFSRKATLEVKATFNFEGEERVITKYVTVLQEPRIVNPKGVWRESGTNDSFHVQLMQATSSYGKPDYDVFRSEGEWTAMVEAGENVVSLTTSGNTVGVLENGVIKGRTGTPIDFNIKFKGDGCGIVKVLYHGNNCVHKIFVRQGYENPIKMGDNYWSSYSLYATKWMNDNERPDKDSGDVWRATLTKNPLSLGSFFRRHRMARAILVKNNNNSDLGPFQDPTGINMLVKVNNNEESNYIWADNNQMDGSGDYGDDRKHPENGLGVFYGENGRKYRVPTYYDYEKLRSTSEFGYGIVYGNGATVTKKTWAEATGFQDSENTGNTDHNLGVRGVIVYNSSNGDQIFFPIGKNGMGCRRNFYNKNPGTLCYSDVMRLLSSNDDYYRPVPYNMKPMPGAIYWIDKWVDGVHVDGNNLIPSLGWDINYFNYDFNSYTQNNYQDACPIKFVLVNDTPEGR